jgi:5'(3')-deoxyribonucleotidase
MIHRIYIDLDDVLNTLVPSVLTLLTVCDGKKLTYEDYPRECGWNIIRAANKMRDEWSGSWTRETFWGALGRDFWATIPKTPECNQLLEFAASAVGREGVFILTNAIGANSLAGKQDWVDTKFPAWMHDRMITCAHKDCCAAYDSLLIDDNQDNIQAFAARGGQVIMRPRPWNDLWDLGDEGGAKYVLAQLGAVFTNKEH